MWQARLRRGGAAQRTGCRGRRRQRRLGDLLRTELLLELIGTEASARSTPVARGELEEAIMRPVRQHDDPPAIRRQGRGSQVMRFCLILGN